MTVLLSTNLFQTKTARRTSLSLQPNRTPLTFTTFLYIIMPTALFGLLAASLTTACGRDEDITLEWMNSECLECGKANEVKMCSDGLDNDEDGLVDCDDPDCEGIGCCSKLGAENNDTACSDGCDNDQDGFTDCKDYSCSKNPAVTVCKTKEKQPEDNRVACSDGLDNDWDGFFDCDDFDCAMSIDVPFCEGNDQTCSDKIDNDGDGFVDCEDYSCSQNPNVTVCQ